MTPPDFSVQSAAQLETVLNASLNGTVIYQALRDEQQTIVDFRLMLLNDVALAAWGQPRDRLLTRPISELFPGDDGAMLIRRLASVVDTGQAARFEMSFGWLRDGAPGDASLHQYDVLVTRLHDGVVLSYEDITARKQDRWALRQQAVQLRGILENIPSSLFVSEVVRGPDGQVTDFRIIEANARGVAYMGLTVEDVIGQLASVVFPQDRANGTFGRYVQVVESGQAQAYTFRYERENGAGWLDVRLVPHGANCVIACATDVTSLKAAELAQQQQTDLLEQVMNTAPTAIVVHQALRNEAGTIVDFRMTKVNQRAADLMNNSVDRIEHRRLSQYFPGIETTSLFAQYRQVVLTGEPTRFEYALGDRWFDFAVARFGDGLVVAATDSTSTRLYRQQLEAANLELKRSNDNLQSFAYVASHDLQEPLRKITSFADILQHQYGPRLDEDIMDIVRRMATSADRMARLIHDLLAYARVGSGREPFRAVALTDLLEGLREDELWTAFHHSGGQLHLEPLPVLKGDGGQLRQLFQNLLGNALKFRREHVPPVIRVSSRLLSRTDLPANLLPAEANPARQYHEISVTDNGIGFDPKYSDRIFQVFQRLHGRSQYEGTGIGLAICQRVAQYHGGAIAVESHPGAGATFRVYLPADDRNARPAPGA